MAIFISKESRIWLVTIAVISMICQIGLAAIAQGYLDTVVGAQQLGASAPLMWSYTAIICFFYSCVLSTDCIDAFSIIFCKNTGEAQPSMVPLQGTSLTVCFVSRGEHIEVLRQSVIAAQKVLSSSYISSRIEVVTDSSVDTYFTDLPSSTIPLVFVVVPAGFICPRGSLYKARALEYARQNRSDLSSSSWILHMDEESHLTDSAMRGIESFLNRSPDLMSFAQGEIRYNLSPFPQNIFSAIVDAPRTGLDLGRFRFQAQVLKRCVIGLHGSFFLTSQKLENFITFDSDSRTCITEDAMFALRATQAGARLHWLQGYVRECSPRTVMDFFKQRRRWFIGLYAISRSPELSFSIRAMLLFQLLSYRLSSLMFLGFNFITVFYYSPWTFSIFWLYNMAKPTIGIGIYRNFLDSHPSATWQRAIVIFFCSPIAAILEKFVPLYALVSPHAGFHVIQKNPVASDETMLASAPARG